MERDIRYIAVGLTVVLLLSAGAALLVLQARDGRDGKGNEYVVAFETAVSGVSVGSAVRYMGMRAGTVTALKLATNQVDRIDVHVQINEDIPVNASTVAQIQPEGITGRSYIGLSTRKRDEAAGPAATHGQTDFPVLPGKPSPFNQILADVPDLINRFSAVAANAERMLASDNREAVAATLDNTATLSKEAVILAQAARTTLGRMDSTLDRLGETIAETRQTVKTARRGMPALEEAAANIARLSARIDRWIVDHGTSYGELGERNLRRLDALIRDVRRTSESVRKLSDQLRNDPSQLIYQPARQGMEIPR